MKTAVNFFRKNYFGRQLPFDYRITMIFFVECLFISIISATTNTLLKAGISGVIFQWCFNLLCIAALFVPLRLRMAVSKPLLLFTTFVYVPFLFFQTAGYDGTAGLFALLTIFMLAVIFKGRQSVILICIDILIWATVCILQFYHPELVVPHGSEQAKFLDYMVALGLSTAGMAILASYIRGAFDIESRHIRSLLQRLEESNKKLSDLSNRDPLTGIYNRRFLMDYLQTETELFERTGVRHCVMMLDLDKFKDINDTYGHGFGDEVLIRFVQSIQSGLRKQDVFARVGGEEFVVVLHDVDITAAREIAERARLAVKELRLRDSVKLTVSIGLAEARRGEGGDGLLKRADACLYRAKKEGRNRVVEG